MRTSQFVPKAHQVDLAVDTQKRRHERHNVGQTERWLSTLGGGAMAIYGVARFDWPGAALAALGATLLYRGTTGHSMLYQALDTTTAFPQSRSSNITSLPHNKGLQIKRTLTIDRTPEDLYAFWRDFAKAPLYMPAIQSVTETGPRTSHWVGKLPTSQSIAWEAELLQDEPGAMIAWQNSAPAATAHAGQVTFKPAPRGRGTEVTLELDYPQFKGPVGLTLGKVAGRIPEYEAMGILRCFKEMMEAGEIATVAGQPAGK